MNLLVLHSVAEEQFLILLVYECLDCFFFFSSRRRHTRSDRDWSSDVCSSDLNTDFADVKMIMTNAGSSLMGIGYASGEGRALNAARAAISSPLLEASIEGARGILLNISGGSDLGLFEVNEAAEIIRGVAHPDANIIFGAVIDDTMGDEVRVTVIAAGFDRWDEAKSGRGERRSALGLETAQHDVFGSADEDDLDLGGGDDDFDVPSFLK